MRFSHSSLIVSIVCGLLLSTLGQSGSRLSAPDVQPNQKETGKSRETENQRWNGFYFGSSSGELGSRAWFLLLDFGTHRGKLHMPPGNLELTHLEISQVGRITFRSAKDIGDLIYQFEGHLQPNGIVGQFNLIRATPQGEKAFAMAPVVVEKLEFPSNSRLSRNVTGVYSNVEYNSEGGDLTGEELILFWNGKKLTAVFTSYEGDMTPYATEDVALTGTNIEFRVLMQSGEERYQGVFSRGRLKLRRTDVNVDPEASQMVLFKRKEIKDIFDKSKVSVRR